MSEFDSDEDELILDDHENEVISSFLYEASWDRCNSTESSVHDLYVKHNSMGLIAQRNLHLSSAFLGKNTVLIMPQI